MRKKFIDYKVVTSGSVRELEDKVNDLIRGDWQLWGNMAVDNDRCYQPMVFYTYYRDMSEE